MRQATSFENVAMCVLLLASLSQLPCARAEGMGYGLNSFVSSGFVTSEDFRKELRRDLKGPVAQPEQCLLDPETGPCRAFFERFYYNTSTQSCENFVYGGCQGNQNRFETREECESTCLTVGSPPEEHNNQTMSAPSRKASGSSQGEQDPPGRASFTPQPPGSSTPPQVPESPTPGAGGSSNKSGEADGPSPPNASSGEDQGQSPGENQGQSAGKDQGQSPGAGQGQSPDEGQGQRPEQPHTSGAAQQTFSSTWAPIVILVLSCLSI